MIKLSRQVNHAKRKRSFSNIWVSHDEHIVVWSILLDVCIFNRTWDVSDPGFFRKRLGDLRAKLTVPLRDVIDDFKAAVVQCLYSVFEKCTFTSLLAKLKRPPHLSHEVGELKLRVFGLSLGMVELIA